MWDKPPPLTELQDAVGDSSMPIGMRMRAAYFLRQVYEDNRKEGTSDHDSSSGCICNTVVETLAKGLLDKRHGSLMRHEFAYVMGQLRDERCCETLEAVLQEPTDCVMVRHEAAEALGAIGAKRSVPALRSVVAANLGIPELADTCILALNVMAWRESGGDPLEMPAACACMLNPYSSVDPAPPNPLHEGLSFEELGGILCDKERPIFERYRAMFSLRNRGGKDAVSQLCRALTTDQSSALLRHEVAYVLGQMQHPSSVEALEASLRREDEHEMVRHESAEALGAINGRWNDVERILRDFLEDECDVVRESCIVALDAADYWGHNVILTRPREHKDSSTVMDTSPKPFAHQKAGNRILVNHFNIKS